MKNADIFTYTDLVDAGLDPMGSVYITGSRPKVRDNPAQAQRVIVIDRGKYVGARGECGVMVQLSDRVLTDRLVCAVEHNRYWRRTVEWELDLLTPGQIIRSWDEHELILDLQRQDHERHQAARDAIDQLRAILTRDLVATLELPQIGEWRFSKISRWDYDDEGAREKITGHSLTLTIEDDDLRKLVRRHAGAKKIIDQYDNVKDPTC